jgi:hypothetical protein
MKCPKCQTENEISAIYCSNCSKLLKKAVKTKEDKKHTIFISHAEADKKIVADFCELLDNILPHFEYKIFCSSGIGSIGCGDDNHKEIHTNLNLTNNVFCLLTENSYDRPWVMYEIGYIKGKSSKKKLMPIAMNDEVLSQISGYPYSRFSIYKCDEESLSEIIIQLLNNLTPNYCKNKEIKFKKSFAPHIKKFLRKIKK